MERVGLAMYQSAMGSRAKEQGMVRKQMEIVRSNPASA